MRFCQAEQHGKDRDVFVEDDNFIRAYRIKRNCKNSLINRTDFVIEIVSIKLDGMPRRIAVYFYKDKDAWKKITALESMELISSIKGGKIGNKEIRRL